MTEKRSGIVFRIILAVLAVLYFAALFKLLFVKNGIRTDTDVLVFKPFRVLSEYRSGTRSLRSVLINYLGNTCLFLPLGLILPAVFNKLNFWKTVIVGLVIIAASETAQYITKSGYADIDDLLINTLGFVLGALIYFFVLGGRKKTTLSYLLTLVVVIAVSGLSYMFVVIAKPEILPQSMLVQNGKIAGNSIEDYSVKTQIYKMSHGDVFVDKEIAEDKDGNKIEEPPKTYRFADTAVFVIAEDVNGEMKYSVTGIEEMISEVENAEPVFVKLWLDGDGRCSMVMLEKEY
ncbi:MAG: VanZ family protein [Clostridia bacterium]|nr:VanZ family protein [Clostridia bacterium]